MGLHVLTAADVVVVTVAPNVLGGVGSIINDVYIILLGHGFVQAETISTHRDQRGGGGDGGA